MNTPEVQARLATHYCGETGAGEEWVLIPEARAGAGFSGNSSQCDLLALHTWESRGLIVVGHEIKVSRGDWLKELKKPAKADWWWKLCHKWYLVVPKPHGDIVKPGELPVGWGLLEVNDKVREVVKPVRPSPVPNPIPWAVIVGWFAQVDRRQKRADDKALKAEYQRGQRDGEDRAHRLSHQGRAQAVDDQIRERAKALREATDIDLFDSGTWGVDDFKRMWKIAQRYGGLPGLVQQIDSMKINAENALKMIDHLVNDAEPLRTRK